MEPGFGLLFQTNAFLGALPEDGNASVSGAGLFALGTVGPIKLKLQTHEFEV